MSAIRNIINLFISARFRVEGDSMLPALAHRETVLAASTGRPNDRLRRGDIVALQPPDPNPELIGRTFIKRIVALPGEVLRLEDGLVYVNEELLQETYLERPFTPSRTIHHEWWMGPDEYFVMGDNRSGSHRDSRYFGPVSRRLILGRVWLRCWPLRAVGLLPRPPSPK